MEMDYNLKKINHSFQVLPVHVKEIVKNGFMVCSSLEKPINSFLPVLYEQFHVRAKVLS